MSKIRTQGWKALVVIAALTTMVGCQGFSAAKAASQSAPQNPIAGSLAATPAGFTFGNVLIGTTQAQSGTLSNTGGSNVTVSAATSSDAGFSVSGLTLPLTLGPGQSVPFTMNFTPQSTGSFSGSFVITSDASNPTLNIPLSGSGTQTAAAGQLSVTPATINAGNVIVGFSGSQTGTLSASGANVTVYAVDISSSEFAVGGVSFPLTIQAGQSVNFTVSFTPQSSGVASVSASFSSSASNSPASATLTGTGVAAPSHSVSLSWNASTSPDISGYNIYRRAGTSGSFIKINSGLDPVTIYLDTAVTDGLTYYYETTAVNSSNEESAR